jgi:putative colanic acid biosynthesis acetyltransferase WcaF
MAAIRLDPAAAIRLAAPAPQSFGAKIAKGARVYGSARISIHAISKWGRGAVLGWNVHCYSMGKIILEDYAEVAQFNHLVTGTHDTESATFQLYTKPIRICSYAWIASGCFIGPGVTVKEGAVLARAAWLSSDLEPWTIYAGNPAVPVRARKNFIRIAQEQDAA